MRFHNLHPWIISNKSWSSNGHSDPFLSLWKIDCKTLRMDWSGILCFGYIHYLSHSRWIPHIYETHQLWERCCIHPKQGIIFPTYECKLSGFSLTISCHDHPRYIQTSPLTSRSSLIRFLVVIANANKIVYYFFYHILWLSRIVVSCLRGKRKPKNKNKRTESYRRQGSKKLNKKSIILVILFFFSIYI